MPQFTVDPQSVSGEKFTLTGDEAHHACRVLRLSPGDSIQLTDGRGRRFEGRVERVDPSSPLVSGVILKTHSAPADRVHIVLCQGLPKGEKFDYLLEKAVELGVNEILPFYSEKNPITWDEKKSLQKRDRWEKLAKAAVKQSGASFSPIIHAPKNWADLLSAIAPSQTLVCHPSPSSLPLKGVLEKGGFEKGLFLVVGPESGFSDREIKDLQEKGARFVSLGPSILRTETAGPALLAVLRFSLGDWENL